MILKFKGETSINKLKKHIADVVANICEQGGLSPDKITVKDAEVGILFEVDGVKNGLQVKHNNIDELFTVVVQLDEKGNIKASEDNSKKTFIDEYTQTIAKGLVKEYPTIESKFKDQDLQYSRKEVVDDIITKEYLIKNSDDILIRYYKTDKGSPRLVAEACI